MRNILVLKSNLEIVNNFNDIFPVVHISPVDWTRYNVNNKLLCLKEAKGRQKGLQFFSKYWNTHVKIIVIPLGFSIAYQIVNLYFVVGTL